MARTDRPLRIATRKSALALWQANFVKAELEEAHPGLVVELVPLMTTGDKILDVPLAKVGGKGLFTKEIEQALHRRARRPGRAQHEGRADAAGAGADARGHRRARGRARRAGLAAGQERRQAAEGRARRHEQPAPPGPAAAPAARTCRSSRSAATSRPGCARSRS